MTRSESEIRWVRSRSLAEAATVTGSLESVSSWHVMIPDLVTPPPGVACGAALTGRLQWDSDLGSRSREGLRCSICEAQLAAWTRKHITHRMLVTR